MLWALGVKGTSSRIVRTAASNRGPQHAGSRHSIARMPGSTVKHWHSGDLFTSLASDVDCQQAKCHPRPTAGHFTLCCLQRHVQGRFCIRCYPHKRWYSRWKLSQELKGKIILATFFAKYTCGNGQSKKTNISKWSPEFTYYLCFTWDGECKFIKNKTL